jgi:hypothetical protein
MMRAKSVLWESSGANVALRVAVGGDFLPAGKLTFPVGGCWRDMALRLGDYFDDVEASFLNLESSLDTQAFARRLLSGIGQIISAPRASLKYLRTIRCHAIGIANNHSYDFGAAGVERTRTAISELGIVPLGAGQTLSCAPQVYVWQAPGDIRIGFWAAASATHDRATRKFPGVEPATLDRALEAHATMKRLGARFSIALLHAGVLRTHFPSPDQVKLMDSIARRGGFDLVAASHSHLISGSRLIATRTDAPSFCFYGLGSLVSGYAATAAEREGLIVVIGFDSRGNLARIEVRPILLGESGFGEIPSPGIGRLILDRFLQISDEITSDSYKRRFYRDVSHGLLQLYLRDVRAAARESGIRGVFRKASRARMRHLRQLVHTVIPSW